jgi:hypothetical protein
MDLVVQALEDHAVLPEPILVPFPDLDLDGLQEQVPDSDAVQEYASLQVEVSVILDPPPAPVMILLQELIHEPEDRPHRSTRLANRSDGMYINVVEKAMKKKKKEVSAISGTTKLSKSSKSSSAIGWNV